MSRGLIENRSTTGTSVFSSWRHEERARRSQRPGRRTRRGPGGSLSPAEPYTSMRTPKRRFRARPARMRLCACSSSTRRPTRPRTTARSPERWRPRGRDVELLTSRALYGDPEPPDGFTLREDFYRRATTGGRGAHGAAALAGRRAPARNAPRAAADADVVHYQWLTAEPVDAFLLARGVPRVFTAHNVLRRIGGRVHELGAPPLARRVDALIAHTRAGAARARRALRRRAGARPRDPARRVRAPDRQPAEAPLPAELAAVEGPGDPQLRDPAAVQGHRRAASRPSTGSTAPSCGSSADR